MELEADEYSGFIMFKLGASLSQTQEAIRVYGSDKDDSYSTHPSKDKRLRAIEKGYNKAKGQGSNNDYSSSTLTADDYFYKAYNNESDWQYKIDNYTKCLRIDPDRTVAYHNRGVAYDRLGNYNDAIADYTRAIRIESDDDGRAMAYKCRGFAYYQLGNNEDAIADYTRALRIDPDYAGAYNNRGIVYDKLKNYEDAIADYTRAIRINPDFALPYANRGVAKENLGLAYCGDYKKACDLGNDWSCERYYKQCR